MIRRTSPAITKMRAYLYFTWEDVEDPEGFAMLKQAMLHDVSDHIFQFGQKGFLFLTDKSYNRVNKAIKEKKGRPFLLIDITEGVSSNRFNSSLNLNDLKAQIQGYDKSSLNVNGILEKIFDLGWASLTQEERDYLHAKSM